jgi:hypothetical protein
MAGYMWFVKTCYVAGQVVRVVSAAAEMTCPPDRQQIKFCAGCVVQLVNGYHRAMNATRLGTRQVLQSVLYSIPGMVQHHAGM